MPAAVVQTGPMASVGSVRTFDADEGWGVIDGPDVPGGCWVHFSALAMDGYRKLTRGQQVSFRAEAARQDGFAYRAVKVWTRGAEPPDQARARSGSAGHHSWVVLTSNPPSPGDEPRTQRKANHERDGLDALM
jgi:CspA family cold shock protein